jgi:hypothetical protein
MKLQSDGYIIAVTDSGGGLPVQARYPSQALKLIILHLPIAFLKLNNAFKNNNNNKNTHINFLTDFILILRKEYNIIRSALEVIETGVRVSGNPFNHSTKDLDYSNRLHSIMVQPDDSHSLREKSELLRQQFDRETE